MHKHAFLDPKWNLQTRISSWKKWSFCFTGSSHAIKLNLTLGSLLDQRSWFMTSSATFCWKHFFWSLKYIWVKWHGWWCHQSTSFIKGYPWCNFQLHNGICRTWDTREGLQPPLNSWYVIKPKILKGLRYMKNRAPSPVTHSLTLTYTRFRKMSRIILLIHYNSIYSFFLDACLFLSLLFQYVEMHSTIGVARMLHKWSRICIASSKINALAFVPPNNVQNSFDQLAALICNQYGNGADGVLDYLLWG